MLSFFQDSDHILAYENKFLSPLVSPSHSPHASSHLYIIPEFSSIKKTEFINVHYIYSIEAHIFYSLSLYNIVSIYILYIHTIYIDTLYFREETHWPNMQRLIACSMFKLYKLMMKYNHRPSMVTSL